ncbi:MAG: aldo/keto reductase [Actinobacteria bacterium]|nr:aldo/keto reductase [Actinomycetota bacterium]
MQTRTLGGVEIGAIGLGAMPMSLEERPDEAQSIATIHAALDEGVTLIDTADAYSLGGDDTGHNERVVARALQTYAGDTAKVIVATKGGHVRPGDGSWELEGDPSHLKAACDASLTALGTDVIDLYQFHRPDPSVAFAESVGALRDLKEEGKIRFAGLSNVSIEQIKEAQEVVEITSVQNQFSPRFRSSEAELEYCASQGIAFLPWSPLGGMSDAADLGSNHAAFADVAEARGVSPQQVALAWELSKAPVVIPIPGASRPETITDSVKAADLELTQEELDRLDSQ